MNDLQPFPSNWTMRKLIGAIIIGLLMGESALVTIVALTRDVILPALARLTGGEQNTPFSLGTQDYGWGDLFGVVLQLCLAAIVSILVYSWSQRGGRVIRTGSLGLAETPPASFAASASIPSVTPSRVPPPFERTEPVAAPSSSTVPPSAIISSTATTFAPSQAKAEAPAPSAAAVAAKPVVENRAQPAAQQAASVAPRPESQPAAQGKAVNPVPLAPAQPTSLPAQVAAQKPQAPPAASKPVKPKKPKEVYYNIVGERISPPDDEGE
jgi:hypothetical protein